MEKLRQLAPWQIIVIAVVVLLIALFGGYFLVTSLTSSKTPTVQAAATVPGNLNNDSNKQVLQSLKNFDPPAVKAATTPQPIQTADPNQPSTRNPFQR